MNYLLDTHVLLWALFEPERISARARKVVENPENEVQVSVLSFWEISLKYQIGKLEFGKCAPDDLPEQVARMGIGLLPMDASLLASSYRLPMDVHKDPFDRLLVWEAIQKNMVLISKDKTLEKYSQAGLRMLW